jgi:hypothetical protein
MMTMVMLKRTNAKLDRDVIFVSEAGEEGNSADVFRKNGPDQPRGGGTTFQRSAGSAEIAAAREYLAINEPNLYSMLHSSISPTSSRVVSKATSFLLKPPPRSISVRCPTKTCRSSVS